MSTTFDASFVPRDRRGKVEWRGLVLTALFLAVTVGSIGCEKLNDKASANEPVPAGREFSATEILSTYRDRLVVIQIKWDESTSLWRRWRRRTKQATGVIVASDAQRALVLTSRRAVDPKYGRGRSIRTRGVTFGVAVPGQHANMQVAHARLVAVFMNDADLALLRIGAPSSPVSAVAVARPGTLRAGDRVTVVGPPAERGFAVSIGTVNNFWRDRKTGGDSLQVSVTAGPAASAGLVFADRGAKLAGVLAGASSGSQATPTVLATPAELLCQRECWDYLIEEGPTRHLLGMID